MSIFNPIHTHSEYYHIIFPPGRLGLVLEQDDDDRFYLEGFRKPIPLVKNIHDNQQTTQLQIRDILCSVNDISVQGVSIRKIYRLFQTKNPKRTLWKRTST